MQVCGITREAVKSHDALLVKKSLASRDLNQFAALCAGILNLAYSLLTFCAPFGCVPSFASAFATCAKAFNPKKPICSELGFSCVGMAARAPCANYGGL